MAGEGSRKDKNIDSAVMREGRHHNTSTFSWGSGKAIIRGFKGELTLEEGVRQPGGRSWPQGVERFRQGGECPNAAEAWSLVGIQGHEFHQTEAIH